MQSIQVTKIRKPGYDERHEHITHIGGDDWFITVEQAIQHIKNKTYDFFVRDSRNQNLISHVGVVPANGFTREHIRTHADGQWGDNLLSLPRV